MPEVDSDRNKLKRKTRPHSSCKKMSLIIENAGNLSYFDVEDAFDKQYNAVVMADMKVSQSLFCITKRKACIYVTTSSIELHRFIRMLERNGSGVIVIKRAAYVIKLENLSRIDEHYNL